MRYVVWTSAISCQKFRDYPTARMYSRMVHATTGRAPYDIIQEKKK